MTFPQINRIEDVLPYVEGRSDFVVARKNGYTVIDYLYAGPDTFDHPIRRECRGLKFDANGDILARPFHKFFNYGEKPETTDVDWSRPHRIFTKLDGSMVHPASFPDNNDGSSYITFMTRMGVTDVAEQAFKFAFDPARFDKYFGFCAKVLSHGFTPIFEYTGPNNRIVVPYSEERLTLLAIRNNKTGQYVKDIASNELVKRYGIPCVEEFANADTAHTDLLDKVRGLPADKYEGVVVQFDDLFVKIKADEYVKFHRAKDSLSTERRVLPLVLEGKVDDLLPLLSDMDKKRIEEYASKVNYGVAVVSHFVAYLVAKLPKDRKEFAAEVSKHHPLIKAAAFRVFDGAAPRSALVSCILARTSSNAKIDEVRGFIGGAKWRDTHKE